MRFAELIARYPTARLATPNDNARILEFFERAPMRSAGFTVQYRRRPDFFGLLRYQADRAHVLITEDAAGAVRGIGTVSLRPAWVAGRLTTVGYLGDLRVRFDRSAGPMWRRLYSEFLARSGEIDELADCTHWFTTILDDNRPARLALGSRRAGLPGYVPLAPFTMRNLIVRLPIPRAGHASRRWQVRDAAPGDRERLAAFFEENNRRLPLGFCGEFERRLARWDGLSVTDFVYAAEGEEIVSCVAPWSPCQVKQTVVSRVPPALRLLGLAASFLPRPPLRIPEAGEPLRSPYLTHLTFSDQLTETARASMFRAMLDHLFDRWRDADWHCVALCDFVDWGLGRALRGFLQQTVPITLYAVVPPGRSSDEVNALRGGGPPAFEMAMV
jgi:hypothetical protein